MGVKCEQYNQVCVISLEGDLTGDNAQATRKKVEEQIDQRQLVDFVVDFEKAGFVDSEGLETLLWVKRRAEDLFGQLKLINLDENVRKILEITRLDEQVALFESVIDAVKSYQE